MIEKVIRAVKSNNKKRGRNITIGAVLGMLLSCTAVMGAGETGLETTKDNSGIIFSKDGTTFIPEDSNDPYPNNEWVGNTYTNNTEILGESSTGTEEGIGINIDGESRKTNLTLLNNGMVSGKNSGGHAFGIGVENLGENRELTIINNGALSGETTSSTPGKRSGYGIDTDSSLRGSFTIENNGLISAKGSYAYGIYITEGKVETLNNNGLILSLGDDSGHGIYTFQKAVLKAIENKWVILAKNVGIYHWTLGKYGEDTDTLINEGSILGAGIGINISSDINGDASVMTNRGIISEENSAKECIEINTMYIELKSKEVADKCKISTDIFSELDDEYINNVDKKDCKNK